MVHRARELLGRAGLSGPTTESLHATVERPQEAPTSVKRLRRLAAGEEQRPRPAAVGGSDDVDLILEPFAEERACDPPAREPRRGRRTEPEDQDIPRLLDALPLEQQPFSCPIDDGE